MALANPLPTATSAISSALSVVASPAQKILSPDSVNASRKEITKLEPPSHWDIDYYTVNGINVPRYISEAQNPIVELHFCTGFNSTPLVYAPIIKRMNELGISVFATKLLQSEELGTDCPEKLITFHLDSTRHFFTDSGIREHNPNIIKVAGTHSAAGGSFANHTANIRSLISITKNFKGGALHITPFFDVANASKRFYPKAHKAFMLSAKRDITRQTSDTLQGQLYSTFHRMRGEPQIFSADKDPTYGEIIALKEHIGDRAIETHETLEWNPALRQRFAIATRDTASCSRTAEIVANLQGAEKTEYNAHHNPALESKENLDRLINRILEMGKSASHDPIAKYTKPKNQAALASP